MTAAAAVDQLSAVPATTVREATDLAVALDTGGGGSNATGDSVPTRMLVLGMTHSDGTIDAQELFGVAEACGFSVEQVRSCLRRLVTEGLLERSGRGGSASFRSTERGLAALQSSMGRTQLAYSQDGAGKGWDRKWHLVAFALPEGMRSTRNILRQGLLDRGGASIQNGLYVNAHDWDDDIRALATELNVDSHVTIAASGELSVGGVSEPRHIARRLWPIDDLALRYEAFVDRYKNVPDSLASLRQRRARLSDSSFIPGAFAMAVALNECFAVDPLLPPELLPRPWPGRSARDLVVRSRRLAVASLQSHTRPTLFRLFDDAIDAVR